MALTAVMLVGFAAPAGADDQIYLAAMHQEYFAHSFTDQQLLAEGHKVCDHSAAYEGNQEGLYQMVAADLGVSSTAGGHVGGGCEGWVGLLASSDFVLQTHSYSVQNRVQIPAAETT